MKRILIILLIVIFLAPMLVQGDGIKPPPKTKTESETTSTSGGGSEDRRVVHRSTNIDLEELLDAVRVWSQDKTKADEYEELRKLLYIPISYQEEYRRPTVKMNYTGEANISRSEEIEISADVWNNNPEEIRSNLYLWLEAKMPGQDEFELVELQPKIILKNEYSETYSYNNRTWKNLTPFRDLSQVGAVKLRIKVDDQHKTYSTDELDLMLVNNLPMLTNMTVAPEPAKWHENVKYIASVADQDRDTLSVTLHIRDEMEVERRNVTKEVIPPSDLTFNSIDYGIFTEEDAGKNFTYYYSFDDGINSSSTMVQTGPKFQRPPKLNVDRLEFYADESYYWWQPYTFEVRANNLNPGEIDVTFTLSVKTGNNDWKFVESKTEKIGPEPKMIFFNNTRPFIVKDADDPFYYRIKLNEITQLETDTIEARGETINSKIYPYTIYDPIMLSNLGLIYIFILALGLVMERTLKRGTESQESSAMRAGGQSLSKLGRDISGKVGCLLNRRR